MPRPLAIIAKTLAVLAGAAGFTVISIVPNAEAAWAPEMVGLELAAQRAAGFSPCQPHISQLPLQDQEQGWLADAIPTPYGNACEIRFAVNVPAEDLHWVAWHEVCHLSTMNQIFADPVRAARDDAAHTDPEFLRCLDLGPADRGGY